MEKMFQRFTVKLAQPLNMRSRLLVFLAALMLVPTFFVPLWKMTFVAQQYPEGLELFIYSHDLVGGDDGNDLTEINVLNHYIGMAPLERKAFTEFKWLPLVIGLIGVLTLRAAVIGTVGSVLDIIAIAGYFALFSLWSFWYKLYSYGHNLDPRASVHVDPFTPPMFGHRMVGQFEVWSFPGFGTYLFIAFGLLIVAGWCFSYRMRPADKK
ncbi:MAG TPA: hypothetical protein ENI92_02460 [Bacteroidetes bacterium]|nr:hypothetical protein [Bacteroidota bacterium]